jgi:hypothetical protein
VFGDDLSPVSKYCFLLADAALVEDGDDLSPVSKYCFLLADAALVDDGDDLSQVSPYCVFTRRCRSSRGWR